MVCADAGVDVTKDNQLIRLLHSHQEFVHVLVKFVSCCVRAGHRRSVGADDDVEFVTSERQTEAHQAIVDALRQTGDCQLFKLDSKVKLIDSPGIVLSKSEDPSELALRNCTKPEALLEPEPAVSAILQRCPKRQIIVQYSIGDFASTTDFLCQLAQRMGKLKKGGVPDSRGAARIIISDWITGKLSHYTLPPESGAPIAEPSLPGAIAIDPVDFPLQEHDEQVFAAMPMKTDSDFCPPAVLPASQPFATFSNEAPHEDALGDDADDMSDENEEEAVEDEEEFESAEEDLPMETE
ncbi:hypothetical protein SprV_0100379300 [Sparganum proliferum]